MHNNVFRILFHLDEKILMQINEPISVVTIYDQVVQMVNCDSVYDMCDAWNTELIEDPSTLEISQKRIDFNMMQG